MLENLGKALTVKDVSRLLGVSRSWVYANAHLLGGVRLGKGKGTLRFFEKRIEEVLEDALQESSERQNSMGSGHQNPGRKDHQNIQVKGRSSGVRGQDQKADKGQGLDKYGLFA